jgi:UDP-glucose 4-epimerase
MRGEPVAIWGDGGAIRDFVYIEDVCDAFIRAAMYNGSSRVFNVGSGVGRSINAVIDDIERVISPLKVHRDYRLSRPIDIPANVLDISLVRREFAWEPQIDWETGLCRMRNWVEGAL